jgi:hypothetical protein
MGLIEESLRETFAAQANRAPAVEDAATRAISAGRRVRRRRRALGVVAVVTSVALVGVGVVSVVGGPIGRNVVGSSPTEAAASVLPVDVLAGNRIVRADGVAIALVGLAQPRRLWKVQSGWLVETWDVETSLAAAWYVNELGGAPRLLAAGDRVAVGRGSFDGPRVAWSQGGQVSFASFVDGRLDSPLSTSGVAGFRPVAIVGTGVLLAGPGGAHDMWFPAQGDYENGPVEHDAYLGASGDGSAFYGVSADDASCLVKVNPFGLARLRTACGLDLTGARRAFASPDLVWVAVAGPERMDIYHLDTVWTHPRPFDSWPISTEAVTWLDQGLLVVGTAGSIVQLDLNNLHLRSETAVAGAGADPVLPAEDLRF